MGRRIESFPLQRIAHDYLWGGPKHRHCIGCIWLNIQAITCEWVSNTNSSAGIYMQSYHHSRYQIFTCAFHSTVFELRCWLPIDLYNTYARNLGIETMKCCTVNIVTMTCFIKLKGLASLQALVSKPAEIFNYISWTSQYLQCHRPIVILSTSSLQQTH
jgi:hypothetical protein